MGIVEKELNSYSKELDRIQSYLVRVVKRYFEVENLSNLETIESIISESISRFKAEVNYEMPPVQSLNTKKGYVNFTLDTINGEQLFDKKLAFNKNFGQATDTVCKGNDPRLFNDRYPIAHKHDVFSLTEVMEKIKAYEEALKNVSKILHLHKNKLTLDKIKNYEVTQEIDLFLLEQMAATLRTHLLQLKTSTESKVFSLTVLINDLKKKNEIFSELFNTTKTRIQEIIDSIGTSIDNEILLRKAFLTELVNSVMEGKVNKTHLDKMLEAIRYNDQLIGDGYLSIVEMGEEPTKTWDIPTEITDQYDFYSDIKIKAWYRKNDIAVPMPTYIIDSGQIQNVLVMNHDFNSITIKNITSNNTAVELAISSDTKNVVVDRTKYGVSIERFGRFPIATSTTGVQYVFNTLVDPYFEYDVDGVRYSFALFSEFYDPNYPSSTATASFTNAQNYLEYYINASAKVAIINDTMLGYIKEIFAETKPSGKAFFYDTSGNKKYIDSAGNVYSASETTKGVAETYFGMAPISTINLSTMGVCPAHFVFMEPIINSDANGISYELTDATCLVKGTKRAKCPFCGQAMTKTFYDDNKVIISPIEGVYGDHTYGDWVIVKEPSYIEDGLKTKTCSTCGDVIQEVIPMLTDCPHENTITERIEPDCTTEGSVTITCTDCNTILSTEVLPALGHDWDDGVITKPATETENGIKTYTCRRCFITREETIPKISAINPGGMIYYQIFGIRKQVDVV